MLQGTRTKNILFLIKDQNKNEKAKVEQRNTGHYPLTLRKVELRRVPCPRVDDVRLRSTRR